MPDFLQKIVGLSQTIEFFTWDLLLKHQTLLVPKLSRMALTSRHAGKVHQVHYFFRFLENLFFRYTCYSYFKPSAAYLNVQKYRPIKQRYTKRTLYFSSLSFVESHFEMYMLAYFTLTYLNKNVQCYLSTRRFGAYYVSLFLKELTSYNVRSLHDNPQDDNWDARTLVRFNINLFSRRKLRQYFSLFKIFRRFK